MQISQDQYLNLLNVEYFTSNLNRLEYFVRNVSLQMVLDGPSLYRKVGRQLHNSFNKHGCKVLTLWSSFVNRLNEKGKGITYVHLTFIQVCLNQQFYKLALVVVETPALPISIQIVQYQLYLLNSARIYNQLQRYTESLDSLGLAKSLNSHDFRISFIILKQYSILSQIVGSQFCDQDFNREFDMIKVESQKNILQITNQHPQILTQIQFQFELFQAICRHNLLQNKQIQYLKNKDMFVLYTKINIGTDKLKRQIKKQLRNQNLYRKKCTQIKDNPMSSFQTIRDINKTQSMYRYDSKNQIMYFQHKTSDQSQLDQLINKTCVMQKIIENRPLDNK